MKSLSSTKGRNKCTLQDVYADEAKKENEMMGKITEQKHEWRLLELQVKCQKLDLQAQEYRFEAEERHCQADHQCEQEREQHELQLLQFRLQCSHAAAHNGSNLPVFGLSTDFTSNFLDTTLPNPNSSY